jgi:hypothetical protein
MGHANVDHRRSRRFRGEVDVDVTDKKGTRRGRAIDVARHGLFVALRDLPANRHLVQLRIYLPEGEVQAAATVARHQVGQGVGLALFAMSDEAKARWDGFLHRTQGAFLEAMARDEQLRHATLAATPAAAGAASSPPNTATSTTTLTSTPTTLTSTPTTLSSTPTLTTPTSTTPVSALSAPPTAASTTATPHPSASTFFLRLRTIDRLREYQRLHVEAGGTILFTPALLPAGAPVTILVVHPVTQGEFPLPGVVQRAVATLPKRLEILFRHRDVAEFERFIDTGHRPATTKPPSAPPTTATFRSDDELEFEIDDAVISDDPVGWDLKSSALPVQQAPIAHDSIPPSPAGEDDFDLQIDVRDHADGSREDEPAPPPDAIPHSDGAPTTLLPADAPATSSSHLALDEVEPASGPGLRPTAYTVACDRCDAPAYQLLLGPCAGTLGLVANLNPFLDQKSKRLVSVPRLVAAPLRLERWRDYVAGGGSGNDLTTLSMLFDAAALAEAPVHPHTDEVLRSTRALERLSALATRLKDDERATTKVGCPACAKGHLTLRRSP